MAVLSCCVNWWKTVRSVSTTPHTHTVSYYWSLCLQESSYCYWPGEVGKEMVYGRLQVGLVKVRGHGDIVERELSLSTTHCPEILTVRMIQLTSWPLQGFPHLSAIHSLIAKLTNALMSSSSKQTVIMCRLDTI